jgi:branched-chain amino acid transport system substrate-binding protein
MKLKTIFRALILTMLFGLLFSACQPAQPTEPEPLKIGVLAPLSGITPTYGISHRDGTQLAFDEWNAKNGVLGRKVVAVLEDSQCAPDSAAIAANKVIDKDGVKFILGEICSKASNAVADVAETRGVLMITPSSTAESITLNSQGQAKKFVYRTCFTNPFQGQVMAKFAANKGFKTAFIMRDNTNNYSATLADAFENTWLAMGNTIVGKASYSAQTTDFSGILNNLGDSKADVLWLPDYYNVVNLVATQMNEKMIPTVMMGGDAWDSADLNLKATEGSYFANFYSAEDPRPVVVQWIKSYKAKYDQAPDSIAAMSYDAANLLLTAIAQTGSADSAQVAKTLATFKYEAVTGPIQFDAFHNPVKPAVVLSIQKGKISFVEMFSP